MPLTVPGYDRGDREAPQETGHLPGRYSVLDRGVLWDYVRNGPEPGS